MRFVNNGFFLYAGMTYEKFFFFFFFFFWNGISLNLNGVGYFIERMTGLNYHFDEEKGDDDEEEGEVSENEVVEENSGASVRNQSDFNSLVLSSFKMSTSSLFLNEVTISSDYSNYEFFSSPILMSSPLSSLTILCFSFISFNDIKLIFPSLSSLSCLKVLYVRKKKEDIKMMSLGDDDLIDNESDVLDLISKYTPNVELLNGCFMPFRFFPFILMTLICI
jgi:hypothetical protein